MKKAVEDKEAILYEDQMDVNYAGYICVPKKDLLSVTLSEDHDWKNHAALEPRLVSQCSSCPKPHVTEGMLRQVPGV